MAVYFVRRVSPGEACGPGSRNQLLKTQSFTANTWDLDATGDTWNTIPHNLDSSPFAAQRYAAGNWSAVLILKGFGFGAVKARAVLARYNSSCVLQQTMVDQERTIVGGSFTAYTFSTIAGVVTFLSDDILLLIVYETAGTVTMEYGQPVLVPASRVDTPAIVTVRPHEYYKRNRRRRSA